MKPRRNKTADWDAVAAGQVELDLVSLLDLIHTVNPTAASLDDATRKRRYALKGKLQSQLLRRFFAVF